MNQPENFKSVEESLENSVNVENQIPDIVATPKLKRKHVDSVKYKKENTLQLMRSDRKQYQEERLKLERLKIEQMLEIEREKLQIKKRRNALLEIRNELLEKISMNANSTSLL